MAPTAAVHDSATLPPDEALHAVAVYPVMVAPPFDAGAFQRTNSEESEPVTETSSGTDGADASVVPDTRVDSALVPPELVALTPIQYVVTLLKPLIAHVSVGAVAVQVPTEDPPVDAAYALAVYDVAPVVADHVAVSELPVGDETARPDGDEVTVIPDVRTDSVLASVTPTQYVDPGDSPVIVHETVGDVVAQLWMGVPPEDAPYADAV